VEAPGIEVLRVAAACGIARCFPEIPAHARPPETIDECPMAPRLLAQVKDPSRLASWP
jgi:hypothetical protein